MVTEAPGQTTHRVAGAAEEALPSGAMPAPVERAFTFAILLSALRCTVQYVILPFVLPWIGVVAEVPAGVRRSRSARSTAGAGRPSKAPPAC